MKNYELPENQIKRPERTLAQSGLISPDKSDYWFLVKVNEYCPTLPRSARIISKYMV